jgi:hypothetical protein
MLAWVVTEGIMAEPNKRSLQAQDLLQYLTPIGRAQAWTGDRKTLMAFASWVYKVKDHPELGAAMAPCTEFLDYRSGMPSSHNTGTSYDGAAFLHKTSGTVIITNRGSETLEDWITNVPAALSLCWKQLGPAVTFAANAVQAARRVLDGDVSQVLVTGNSLGGACAEAQAALLNAELKRRGDQPAAKIGGHCSASAAFGKIIKNHAAETYSGLTAATFDLKKTLTHLIRENDPIMAQHDWLDGEILGRVDDDIASIFVVNFVTRKPPGGKGPLRQRWEIQADASNHNDFYYYRFIDLAKTWHVIKPKSQDFFWEPGGAPKKLVYKPEELPEQYR